MAEASVQKGHGNLIVRKNICLPYQICGACLCLVGYAYQKSSHHEIKQIHP
jgi:hypothetical protein